MLSNLEKRDIAVKQIKAAARHYEKGDYICSITLSSAAEEILGQIAKKQRGINQLEGDVIHLKSFYDYFLVPKPSDKVIIKKINSVKNDLKHNNSGENEWVEADFENEASLFFIKAVRNYFDCYEELPNDRLVKNLFNHLTL